MFSMNFEKLSNMKKIATMIIDIFPILKFFYSIQFDIVCVILYKNIFFNTNNYVVKKFGKE